MKLDLNKFYNSNYNNFVHKEALEEALRMVTEIDLKEVEIDTILSMTFSVDEFGENPIYVEYLDKDGKKHIVRIRPAVTNEIQEMLKRYVTLEQHETDKQNIYSHFEHIHVPMEIRSKNGLDEDGNKSIALNNDNSYLSLEVDPESDDEIQWLCIHNNGGLGSQPMYFARFKNYAKADQVPSKTEFLEKTQQLEELIHRKSQETLQNSKEYRFLTLENLSTIIGDPQPLDINVIYNGSVLELNNYSTYTTIGNSTIVNINCNFTAPFSSGTTPILNTLSISSETLKSFPLFMMDAIVKTATNVSSYTTTTTFSNKVTSLYLETPVIKPDETIATSLISFNGSYIFNNTKEGEHND